MRDKHEDDPQASDGKAPRGLLDLKQSIEMVERMIGIGKKFAEDVGWGQKKGVALYFHWYGYASVNSLHMHIVDLDFAVRMHSISLCLHASLFLAPCMLGATALSAPCGRSALTRPPFEPRMH